jgi:beta-ring hydroxylase
MWAQQRKLLSPAFHYLALERLESVFVRAADRLVTSIANACAAPANSVRAATGTDESAVVPLGSNRCDAELSATFRRVTLEVISEIAIGFTPEKAGVFPALFEGVLEELNERVFHPWRALYPVVEYNHRKGLSKLNSIVQHMIDERRAKKGIPAPTAAEAAPKAGGLSKAVAEEAGAADGNDINAPDAVGTSASGKVIFEGGCDMLDMMLDSGIRLTDTQLMDELKTQLLAGHETSSMMLTWSCYLLARHPEAMAKAVAEVDRVLGLEPGVTQSPVAGAQVKAKPSFADYKGLDFIGYVLKEAMRLYSPVPILTRECVKDDTLGGMHIPAGTGIMVSVWALHRSKLIWGEDADDFKPERFNDENSKGRHPYAFIPFSQGPRNCIGQNLAIVEAKVVLGTLLRKYKLVLKPGQPEPVTDCYIIPVRPAGGLHAIMEPRK